MSERFWKAESLEPLIIDILSKKQSAVKDKELYMMLKELIRSMTPKDFSRALMRLELWGFIRVTSHKKTMKLIELLKTENGGRRFAQGG